MPWQNTRLYECVGRGKSLKEVRRNKCEVHSGCKRNENKLRAMKKGKWCRGR